MWRNILLGCAVFSFEQIPLVCLSHIIFVSKYSSEITAGFIVRYIPSFYYTLFLIYDYIPRLSIKQAPKVIFLWRNINSYEFQFYTSDELVFYWIFILYRIMLIAPINHKTKLSHKLSILKTGFTPKVNFCWRCIS